MSCRVRPKDSSGRYQILRPHLECGRALTVVASEAGVAYSTAQRWVSLYRRFGLRPSRAKGALIGVSNVQMFLCDLPGYSPPKGAMRGKPTLTLNQFDSLLRSFFVNVYNERTHSETKIPPAARARGRKGGRPRKLQAKELKTIQALLKTAEISVQEVATRFGVSRSTLYRNDLAKLSDREFRRHSLGSR